MFHERIDSVDRQFNAPTIDEFAIVIVANMEMRDIVLTCRNTRQFNIRFVLHSP